ncbi:hypothetical protein PF004_g31446 [Phytophthora fragariae]|uniref:Uncharacterized protein n=1 Tax=Phytophthora fragariae TaxID=53985 RepID=A0A6G0M920_9STRA|nr:hypothetical protein PF004_g31446 [Phytophthora fragariae]
MSPSPSRVCRAACVAAVMGGVSLHAVAIARTSSPRAGLPPAAPQTCCTTSKCHRHLPCPPCCLRRCRDRRSAFPRRSERHQHRVRELDFRQHRHELVVQIPIVAVASSSSTVLLSESSC